jgi:hypothetical protein
MGMNPKPSEHEIQAAVIQWCDIMANQDYRYGLIYAIPNARKISPAGMNYCRQEGLRKGFPDTCLPWGNGKYNALYIEFKKGTNQPSIEQMEWARKLHRAGNLCYCINDIELAKKTITGYLFFK